MRGTALASHQLIERFRSTPKAIVGRPAAKSSRIPARGRDRRVIVRRVDQVQTLRASRGDAAMADACRCGSAHLSRRFVVAGLICTAMAPAPILAAAADLSTVDDEHFMRLALDEARHADFPFGAVIVRAGRVMHAAATSGAAPAIRRRTARWLRSGAVSACTAAG
jgi:hypothetical protein